MPLETPVYDLVFSEAIHHAADTDDEQLLDLLQGMHLDTDPSRGGWWAAAPEDIVGQVAQVRDAVANPAHLVNVLQTYDPQGNRLYAEHDPADCPVCLARGEAAELEQDSAVKTRYDHGLTSCPDGDPDCAACQLEP